MKQKLKNIANNEKLKFMFNEDYKKTSPVWKNYFFVTTVFIIMLNIIIHAWAQGWQWRAFDTSQNHLRNLWTDTLNFTNITISFFNSFDHLNWQHTMLNMLCFFVCGLYLERKKGSLKFFLLVIAMAFFTSIAISANNASPSWRGFSGVNFGLYLYIFVDYGFSFRENRKILTSKFHNRFDFIFGTVVLALIYFAMCFSGGTHSFSFRWYPYDLFNNMGHYSGALTGLILALTLKIAKFGYIKKEKNKATKIEQVEQVRIVKSIESNIQIKTQALIETETNIS